MNVSFHNLDPRYENDRNPLEADVVLVEEI